MRNTPRRVGRPSLNNPVQMGFRLTPEAIRLADEGTLLHRNAFGGEASRSAWIRSLIAETAKTPIGSRITLEQLREHWEHSQPAPGNHTKITASIEEPQRITLRQFECEAQALDWTLQLGQ